MKYKLDPEEEEFDFEGWAFVLFHSSLPGYAFADSLNRLYDYRLQRVDDMVVDEANWPLYRHEDATRHMLLFLVERPSSAVAAPWEAGDKLLAVKGETAEELARYLCADFTGNTEVDDGDLLAKEHAELLTSLLENFTVATLLDFDTPSATRKSQRERLAVKQWCNGLLDYIECNRLDLL